jgi:hypothetical protein
VAWFRQATEPADLLARFLFTERTSIKAIGTFPLQTLYSYLFSQVATADILEIVLTTRFFGDLATLKQLFGAACFSFIGILVIGELLTHICTLSCRLRLVSPLSPRNEPYFLLLLPPPRW